MKRGHTDAVTVGAKAPLLRLGDDSTLVGGRNDCRVSMDDLNVYFFVEHVECSNMEAQCSRRCFLFSL
jgi:hypothetical protein